MDTTTEFENARPRLTALAARMLGSRAEGEDAVQETWLRLDRTDVTGVENLAGWLTTTCSRICLDHLRSRRPHAELTDVADEAGPDEPQHEVEMAEQVGLALGVVLDTLAPAERLAYVLHDVFAVPFDEIAEVLGRSSAAVRQLASRARRRVRGEPEPERGVDREVVDAFLAASRAGEFGRLMAMLDPEAVAIADDAAMAIGTIPRTEGAHAVATLFSGGAKAAFPAEIDGDPCLAWFHKGEAKVVFDFRIVDGRVTGIEFLADPGVLERVTRR